MRILVAEDEPVSRRLLEASLSKWGYEVVTASDGVETWRALQEDNAPRLAILDWMMPGGDGIETCQRLRKRTAEPYVYVLLLTAKGQKQDLLEGLEAGADDYLTKPFDSLELKARLRAGTRILDLQEQLIAAREQMRVQATHDALTGIWNRAAILETLQRELARSERQKLPVAIIMVDIDHFKQINDSHGHLAGDAVLREAARRLRSSIRPYDSIGRYGGEEFLIIVPGTNPQGAFSQAERLRVSMSREPITFSDGHVNVTISLGVTVNSGGEKGEELIHAADAALYRAKSRGRNRTEHSCGT